MSIDKSKVSKGEVAVVSQSFTNHVYVGPDKVAETGSLPHYSDACQANTALIAEAFNVFTETGMTPRELAKRVEHLREVERRAGFVVDGYRANGKLHHEIALLEAAPTEAKG